MPRDASGNYTLPTGNPVVSGTIITSTWANATMPDIGNEITNSLSRQGEGGMLAPLKGVNGTALMPSFTFLNDIQSGLYLASVGRVELSAAGVSMMRWDSGAGSPLVYTSATFGIGTSDQPLNSGVNYFQFFVNTTFTDPTLRSNGIQSAITQNFTLAPNTKGGRAIHGRMAVGASNTQDWTTQGAYAVAAEMITDNGASGTIEKMAAFAISIANTSAALTVTSAYGISATYIGLDGGFGGDPIESVAALAFPQIVNATNTVQLLLGTVTIPAGNWCLYDVTGYDSHLSGALNFGDTAGVTHGTVEHDGSELLVRNVVHGEAVRLQAEDSGGVLRQLFVGSPDAGGEIYYTGSVVARTVLAANGGLEINNMLTGAGFERALTTADLNTTPLHTFLVDFVINSVVSDFLGTVTVQGVAIEDQVSGVKYVTLNIIAEVVASGTGDDETSNNALIAFWRPEAICATVLTQRGDSTNQYLINAQVEVDGSMTFWEGPSAANGVYTGTISYLITP